MTQRPALMAVVLIVVMVVVVYSRPAGAENRETPRVVSIQDAVETALRQNLELKASEHDRDAAKGTLLQTRAYPNPELELGVETDRLFAGDGEGRRSVGIAQTIVTAGKRGRRQANARLGVSVVEQTIEDAKRRLIGEVEDAFYRLVLTQERLKVAREQIELGDRLVALSEGRFREGFAPEMDVTLARVEYHTRLQEVIALEQELIDARAALNTLMGRTVDEPVVAEGVLLVPSTLSKTEVSLQEEAFARRPDLRALNLESEREAGEVALVRAERIPDIRISFDVTEERAVFDEPRFSDRDRLVGMTLSIPIPVFDRKRGELFSAQSRLRRAESERAALRARIAQDVHVASTRIASAEQRLAHFRSDVVPLAKTNLELTRQAYEQGLAGFLQILEAQRRFAETQLGYLTVQYEHRLALASLARDVGRRVVEPQPGTIEPQGDRP